MTRRAFGNRGTCRCCQRMDVAVSQSRALSYTATLIIVDADFRRWAAFIRRCDRRERTARRNAHRVGRGARRAARRRDLGGARRFAQRLARRYPGQITRSMVAWR